MWTYKKQNKYFDLWNAYFKLNKRVFKKGKKYTFSHMIRTDGISCCILFVKVDSNGKPLSKRNKKCYQEENIDYIEKAELTTELKNKKFVVADPNFGDLIYCAYKDENDKLITFRYTQNQRRLETRMKKYSKIRDKINKITVINEQSVKDLETTLSNLNSKTCNYDKFKIYCIEKNKLNYQLYQHYEQKCFRKFKLNAFTNTQKSEKKIKNKLRNKHGKPQQRIIF